jgi:outer membrane protein OmpA-like peptidoglycan-associated protein
VNRAPRFGRGGRNPVVIVVAGIASVIVVVLVVLYITRKNPPASHAPDIVAVVVSGTSSGSQEAEFGKLLDYAVSKGDVLIVASARHSDVAQSVSLAATGINNLDRQQNQANAKKVATQLYQAAAEPGGNIDLQTSFDAVYNILHTIPHTHVWVAALGPVSDVADGVSLSDPLTRGDPAVSISSIPGGFITSCAGWDLNVAEGGTQPSSLSEDQDREFWRRLMGSCGGQLTAWTLLIGVFPSTGEVAAWNGDGSCGVSFELAGQALFNTNQYQLLPGADPTLGHILGTVEDASQPHLDIDGYTDSQGTVAYNRVLSKNRAKAVANWFLARGLHSSQITAAGHGEADPVASNATEQGRQLNRRVQITLTYRGCTPG